MAYFVYILQSENVIRLSYFHPLQSSCHAASQ
jgi:hypothetical protein